MEIKSQIKNLLDWFSQNARKAPWRNLPAGKRNPYYTWVSEIMLQQTQFSTVIPYFEKWIQKFPNIEHLAQSKEEEVLRLWKGLGYYRRARFLHRGSKILLQNYGGQFPNNPKTLRTIPGVGEYTSGAILSLSFNLPEPILDGNLIRIFSRLLLIPNYPENKKQEQPYWEMALLWIQHKNPGLVNEALMELGALVCTKNQPLCTVCPLAKCCKAFSEKRVHEFPPTKKRTPAEALAGAAWIFSTSTQCFLMRANAGFLKDQWMFPLDFGKDSKYSSVALNLPKMDSMGIVKHTIMHFKITLEVYLIKLPQSSNKVKTSRSNQEIVQYLQQQVKEGLCIPVSFTEVPQTLTNKLGQKIWAIAESSLR